VEMLAIGEISELLVLPADWNWSTFSDSVIAEPLEQCVEPGKLLGQIGDEILRVSIFT
jgi:hypothetical protein